MIELKNVKKSFDKNKIIYDDLNLKINAGEIVGIVAPNGMGKSVLLDMMIGKIHPDYGERKCTFNKRDGIAYVNQKNYFPENLTVYEVIKLQLISRGNKIVENKIFDSLKKYNLFDIKHKMATKLSGGQQRKLAFISQMLCEPTLCVLDEPTTGMDRDSIELFYKDIKLQEGVSTIVITSHNTKDLLNVCTRILFLKDKKVAFSLEKIYFEKFEEIYSYYYGGIEE